MIENSVLGHQNKDGRVLPPRPALPSDLDPTAAGISNESAKHRGKNQSGNEAENPEIMTFQYRRRLH